MKMTNKEKYLAIENGYALQMGRCEYEELMTYVDLYHDVDCMVAASLRCKGNFKGRVVQHLKEVKTSFILLDIM